MGKLLVLLLALIATSGLPACSKAVQPSGSSGRNPAECANILAFGGHRTGAGDNNSAFVSALASAAPSHCVYFPAGTYLFDSSIPLSLPATAAGASVTLRGDGQEVSDLKFANGANGIDLTLNEATQSFHIRDLTVLTAGTSGTTNGINVVQKNAALSNPAQSDISFVTVRGSDGHNLADHWGVGINMTSVSNVDIVSTNVQGGCNGCAWASASGPVCISAQGSATSIPVQINIIGSQANYCSYGFRYGDHLQGVSISASNFVGDWVGVGNLPGNSGNDQLAVSSSQFNDGFADIAINALMDGVLIAGNNFYVQSDGATALKIAMIDSFSVTGNTFIGLGAASTGVEIASDGAGVITGNQFKGAGFATAIALKPGSTRVNVQSNSYWNLRSTVVDKGTGNIIGGGTQ